MKTGEIIVSILETIAKLALFIFLAMCIYKGALMSYDYGYRVFTEDPISVGEGRIISVEIKEDMSTMDIAKMLQDKGLIREAKIFYLQELLSDYRGKEVPGIYDLSTAMTAEEMLAVICPNPDSLEVEEDFAVVEENIPEESSEELLDETGDGIVDGDVNSEILEGDSE